VPVATGLKHSDTFAKGNFVISYSSDARNSAGIRAGQCFEFFFSMRNMLHLFDFPDPMFLVMLLNLAVE
jgi:hypothetical protein